MHRRSFLKTSAFALGTMTLAQQKLVTTFFDDPWKITMLRNDVGVFTERGGTIAFLLGNDGLVVVDSQFPEQSKHLIDELKKKSEKPFSLLINTHHHGDHSAGNISFKGIVAHVLAHENSLKNQKNVAAAQKSEDRQLFPDKTFKDTWSEQAGKEKIGLYYYGAAHTDGDSFIHFENANIVHCGDLVANHRHPNVDRGAGANMKSWMTVIDKALKKFDKNTIYVFGHAGSGYEVTGKATDLEIFRDYLGNVLKFAEAEIKAGKTREEILKTTVIPGADDWKSDGIQRPLGAAYDELTAK